MARLPAIVVLCLFVGPSAASVEFSARLEQASWTVDSAPDGCVLSHEIPRYGVARFEARSGHPLSFRLEGDLSAPSGGSTRLVLVAPRWRHDLIPRPLGSVPAGEGAGVVLDETTTLDLYHALASGYQLSVEHATPGQGGFQTLAAVSPVRFRAGAADFRHCLDRMIHLDFQPVHRWQVYFDTNASRLDARAHETLREVLDTWRGQRDLRVVVAGHADGRGDADVNDPLSRRRAEAVRTFLDVYGVPGHRIEVRAFGAAWPEDAGEDETAWAKNRRATVWLAR